MILPKYKPVDIPGYDGQYGVTMDGQVYSFKSKKFMKFEIDKAGYFKIQLSKNNKIKHYLLHRLVANAFIPNPNNYLEINHKDENKQNNHISNLEWCDRKYNVNYGTGPKRRGEAIKGENHYMYGKHHTEETKKKMSKSRIGINKGPKSPNAKKVKCIETGKIFNCIKDAKEFLGAKGHGNISACCKGKRKKAYGYHWEYVK